MSRRTTSLLKAALSALHYTRAHSLAAPMTAGAGVVFMLHHVLPDPPRDFEPNRVLKITPDYLDAVIRHVLAAGFDPVSLDEVPARLAKRGPRPFACFTFDDGYRDNREFALPVFRRHGVPLTIYVPADYAEGEGDLWWLTLEAAVTRLPEVRVTMNGEACTFAAKTAAEKTEAFHAVYWWLRSLPEREARVIVSGLAAEAGYSPAGLCSELVMSWDELRELASDPLVTIGAHTCGHFALAKLDEASARAEMRDSIARIEAKLGRPCRHFSYPYGDERSAGEREFRIASELGLATAVTTRKGLLHAHHASQFMALPRLSLNGDYQDVRYLDVLLSGFPFAVRDAVKRVLKPAA